MIKGDKILKIKIATDDPQSMAQDGASILRSLQNKSIPLLDLIVRESIQNSLDAGIDGIGKTRVDFHFGDFDADSLARHLEGVSDELLSNYCNKTKFLAISDKNTFGLTGAVSGDSYDDLVNSNFHKLVFGIGKNQEKEGAGGSWGLGKTSFFRVGNGIVIYYTRIKTADSYEERLIGSLIENNKLEDRLLPKSNRGIAWWGEEGSNNQILPITDTDKIKEILNLFNLKPYQANETGTTILIPFLREDISDLQNNGSSYYWTNNLESSIKLSVLRWYFPRLMNMTYRNHFNSNMLVCSVNEETINVESEVIFNIFQKLYNSALLGYSMADKIVVHPIKLSRKACEDTNKPIGFIAYIEASEEDLEMCPPNNCPPPLAYLGKSSLTEASNEIKIFSYCRQPGMIVEYDSDNSWLPSSKLLEDKRMLISIFVPVSKEKLSSRFYPNFPTIESYLRSIENADHANWLDENGFTLIKRLKGGIRNSILTDFEENELSETGTETSRLSKVLGKFLLPPTGYGKNSSLDINSENRQSRNAGLKCSLSISSVNIVDGMKVILKVKVRVPKNHKVKVKLLLETQDGHIDYNKWHADFEDIPYPFSITSVKDLNDSYFKNLNDFINQGEFVLPLVDQDIRTELEIIVLKNSNQYRPTMIITQ